MAKSSSKKHIKTANRDLKIYSFIEAAIATFFILYRILYKWETFGKRAFVLMSILLFIEFFLISRIFDLTRKGYPSEYFKDVLIVNWFVHFTSAFSGWFWVFYASVPVYALYKLMDLIIQWKNFGSTNNTNVKSRSERRKKNK